MFTDPRVWMTTPLGRGINKPHPNAAAQRNIGSRDHAPAALAQYRELAGQNSPPTSRFCQALIGSNASDKRSRGRALEDGLMFARPIGYLRDTTFIRFMWVATPGSVPQESVG